MKSYLVESLVRLFYPSFCEICKKPLSLDERLLCAGCLEDLEALAWPFEDTLLDESFEHLDHVWAIFAYRSPLRELLHSVKYHRKDYLMNAVRQRSVGLAQAITTDLCYDALVPVPIDRRKYMERHFNQAEVLAEFLKSHVRPPLRSKLLEKSRHIPSQTSLNRMEREINIYGAFKLRCFGPRIRGRSFLLIDDVFTTGSTANEAGRVLKEAGAKRVDLLALARTAEK